MIICCKAWDRGRFIERLAVSFDNFNTLHPSFREGNGRTQRVFLDADSEGCRLGPGLVAGVQA
jgi:fido (protein-threonine AMPylation protein)